MNKTILIPGKLYKIMSEKHFYGGGDITKINYKGSHIRRFLKNTVVMFLEEREDTIRPRLIEYYFLGPSGEILADSVSSLLRESFHNKFEQI